MPRQIPKLLQLALDNSRAERDFRIVAKDGAATIYVYDVIGGYWGGVSAEQFARDLAQLDAQTIQLRINSPGGDVFEARAMMTALRQHGAKISVSVDGIAASAATSLMMAGDTVEMARGARVMIHNAWTIMMGNAGELRAEADLLDSLDGEIIADYKSKTGQTDQQLQDWMKAETWFSADQAKEAGFVDAIIETTANPSNRWNLSAYANVPKELLSQSTRPSRAMLDRRLKLLETCSA